MRIAWVTHRDVVHGTGGAEASDREMLQRRPKGTDVILVGPGGVDMDLADFDKVIVTGVYGFSSRELNQLAKMKPVFWVHDAQFSSLWFNEMVDKLILLTPDHEGYQLSKTPQLDKKKVFINPGWMDTTELHGGTKIPEFALWAHRPEPHKGLDLAQKWAEDNNMPMKILVGETRERVHMAMSVASHFVLLSHIFDPGPRSVIEAALSGCELVINDQVGTPGFIGSRLRHFMDSNDKVFWELVLNG